MSDFFKSGAFLGNGLASFAMGAHVAPMVESTPAVTSEDPNANKPDNMLENNSGKPAEPAKEMTVELANKMLLEAAQAKAKSDSLESAAEAVMEWARGGDTSFDALDGYALALAGITEDEEDDDITPEQDDAYNAAWSSFADFMVGAGADADEVVSLCDDGDDDAAASIASSLASLSDDDEAQLVFAFSAGGDSAMTEAVEKVFRHGKMVLKRKPTHRVVLSAKQKAALKKARMKANTSAAKLSRLKTMKLRRKRLG